MVRAVEVIKEEWALGMPPVLKNTPQFQRWVRRYSRGILRDCATLQEINAAIKTGLSKTLPCTVLLSFVFEFGVIRRGELCLLYTSDAADDLLCVDLGGR